VLTELSAVDFALLAEVKQAVGYRETELYASLPDGGETTFWTGEVTGLEHAARVEGKGRYVRQDATFRDVFWTLQIEYAPLALGGEATGGAAALAIHEELFEGSYTDLEGEGSLDGLGAFTYAALFTNTLQRIDGVLDGREVHWETGTPDVP
jgi:hypothetical protein